MSRGHIADYMQHHRHHTDIHKLRSHFNDVIGWAESVFRIVRHEMKSQPWGALYDQYHLCPYDPGRVEEQVAALMDDPYVVKKRGIYAYVLGGCQDTRLLEVRVFDDAVERSVYAKQTKQAQEKHVSNCPLCALGHDSNRTRIYKISENGRRPRHRMEQRRKDHRTKLPNALQKRTTARRGISRGASPGIGPLDINQS